MKKGRSNNQLKSKNHKYKRYPATVIKGEDVHKSKLTEEQVIQIRTEHAAGSSYSKLGQKFCVTKENIGAIIRRETWKHLDQKAAA